MRILLGELVYSAPPLLGEAVQTRGIEGPGLPSALQGRRRARVVKLKVPHRVHGLDSDNYVFSW